GRSILSYALEHGKTDVVDYLFTKKVKPTMDDIVSLVKGGHDDIFNKVLTTFPELVTECKTWKNTDGNSLAHLAAAHGFTGIITTLDSHKIPLNSVNNAGQTALHSAVLQDRYYLIDKLVKAGIDIDKRDANGESALIVAARKGSEECIVEL